MSKIKKWKTEELNPGPNLVQVRGFWEANPLSALENPFPVGSKEFFTWHDQMRRGDTEPFSMHLYEFDAHTGERVLDVGCGTGWLCWHFAAKQAKVTGVDLTMRGVKLTRQRLALDGLQCPLVQGSAEQLPFKSDYFDFITCTGVLHHTPNTIYGIQEIYRVLRPGGRAMINLYYRNWLLSEPLWPLTRFLVQNLLGQLSGREAFRQVNTVDDFVRIYDGNENPLGKCYSRREVLALLNDFTIEHLAVHYFPLRFFPFSNLIPRWFHRLLDRYCGLLIYGSLRKDV